MDHSSTLSLLEADSAGMDRRMVLLVGLLFASLLCAVTPVRGEKGYVVDWEAKGTSFFDQFNFITSDDPSHGFVNYVNRTTAVAKGLISVDGQGRVKFSTDTTHVVPDGSRGRDSVRVESKHLFNKGLFLADVEHIPTGCGTWPAWWTYGVYGWPQNGEIDIIENVHTSTRNAATLHTNAGCSMANVNTSQTMTGTYVNEDCISNPGNGCGVQAPANTFGAPFNSAKGGVYAMEWTSSMIRTWFFPRASIPSDIADGKPNPGSWGLPYAYWQLGADNCPESHFQNHTMVINLTFCGDWAGESWTWSNFCSSTGTTCIDYVRNNPSAFEEAYWVFNWVRVYQMGELPPGSSASKLSPPSLLF